MWRAQLQLVASTPSEIPGGDPVRAVLLSPGAKRIGEDGDELVDVGSVSDESTVTLELRYTPKLERALKGTSQTPKADAVLLDGDTYNIRRLQRPNRRMVRMILERSE